MTPEQVLMEKEGPICTITINRPERRNAMNDAVLKDLIAAFDGVAKDGQTRVVILRGAGNQAFCSGFDLSRYKARRPETLEQAYSAIETCPRPVIAMVYGYAIGGGLILALCSDVVIAADNAQFAFTMVKVGAMPPPLALERSINVIGLARTRWLALTGRMIDAREAEAIGLASRVVPADRLHSATRETALEIAGNAPLSVEATKTAINRIVRCRETDSQVVAELNAVTLRLQETEDSVEGHQAFAEKRPPRFTGR